MRFQAAKPIIVIRIDMNSSDYCGSAYWRAGGKVCGSVGTINLKKPFDAVLYVDLDATFNCSGIWRLERVEVETALTKTESKARARGQLSVAEFKRIGRRIWPVS